MKKPSVDFFKEKKKKVTKKRLSSPLANNLLTVVFEHEIMSVDILWGMLNHTLISLAKHFEKYDFKVIRSVAASDEQKTSAFIFLFQTMTISSYQIRSGPSIFDDNNLQNFLLKNRNNTRLLWINDEGKILALKDRPIMSTTLLLQKILKDPQKFGVSKKIIQALKRKNKIYVGKEILSDKRKWLLVEVEEVFEPKGKNYFY